MDNYLTSLLNKREFLQQQLVYYEEMIELQQNTNGVTEVRDYLFEKFYASLTRDQCMTIAQEIINHIQANSQIISEQPASIIFLGIMKIIDDGYSLGI